MSNLEALLDETATATATTMGGKLSACAAIAELLRIADRAKRIHELVMVQLQDDSAQERTFAQRVGDVRTAATAIAQSADRILG
jgi:hypothetical protein